MHSESVKSAMKIVANDKDMFESRISAGAKEKTTYLSFRENLMQKQYLLGLMTWKVTRRNVWKGIANLAHKTTQQLCKVATPCMDDHQFKEEEHESVGELSTVCSQSVLKCLYLARSGRPDILWYVNKLARAVTKWIVSRLWFCGRPWRLKIDIRRGLVYFRKSHVCANKWMCKKQISVSQSSTEAEIIFCRCRFTHGRYSRSHSLGYGEWSISFRTEQNRWTQERAAGKPSAIVKWNMHNTIPIKDTNVLPKNIDHIQSNTMNSDSSAMLYVFEDKWGGNQNDFQRSKSQQWDMFHEPTELLWIGCLTGLIWTHKFKSVTLTPNTKSQTCWLKGISHTWWVDQSSSFVKYQPFQLHLLYQEFQLDKLLHNGEEDSESKGRRMSCVQVATSSIEYVFLFYCDKFPRRIESDCIKKSGDADGVGETR